MPPGFAGTCVCPGQNVGKLRVFWRVWSRKLSKSPCSRQCQPAARSHSPLSMPPGFSGGASRACPASRSGTTPSAADRYRVGRIGFRNRVHPAFAGSDATVGRCGGALRGSPAFAAALARQGSCDVSRGGKKTTAEGRRGCKSGGRPFAVEASVRRRGSNAMPAQTQTLLRLRNPLPCRRLCRFRLSTHVLCVLAFSTVLMNKSNFHGRCFKGLQRFGRSIFQNGISLERAIRVLAVPGAGRCWLTRCDPCIATGTSPVTASLCAKAPATRRLVTLEHLRLSGRFSQGERM